MRFDLIIPVYNDKVGLYKSLMSVGAEISQIADVTIVDDCSDESYDDIIPLFQRIMPIRILKLKKNVGPGLARQYGIDHTRNEYITFLDCGDQFISPTILRDMYETVSNNPDVNMFCWGHIDSIGREYPCDHNRMHGKVYRRLFLQQHNIRFNPEGSYANEDIGFNKACRMILAQYEQELNKCFIFSGTANVIIWDLEQMDSLTRRNNYELYFNGQNKNLAINGGYAIDLAKRERVTDPILARDIYEMMCDMYFKYMSTVVQRPEFIENAFDGALQFYCQYFRPFSEYDTAMLVEMYYNVLVGYLSDPFDYIRAKFVPLDFIGFLQELEEKANSLEKNNG